MTRSVAMHSRSAEVVIVAVGLPHFLGPDMIKPGAAVIHIGINQRIAHDGTVSIVGDVGTGAAKELWQAGSRGSRVAWGQ